jgi:hypothetical protein
MTAPSIVSGYTEAGNGGNSTTLVINTPTHTDGDKIYVVWVTDGDSATASISGSGWTTLEGPQDVPTNLSATAGTFYVWYKTASSEGASYTITTSVSERSLAVAFAATGDNGIDAEGTYGSGTDLSAEVSSVTSTQADTLRISVIVSPRSPLSISTLTDHTLLGTHTYASAGTISVQYKTLTSAGTDSGVTATTDDDGWGTFTWAIAPNAGGAQNVTLPFITETETVYQPTVDPVSVDVVLPFVSETETVYQPTVTYGAQTVTLSFITETETVYQPSITLGAVTVTLSFISETETVYQPLIQQGLQDVVLPFVAETETVYSPAITLGAVTIVLPLVATAEAVYAPRVRVVAEATAPDSRTWVIEVDNRTWSIPAEDRTWVIEYENRTYTVQGD